MHQPIPLVPFHRELWGIWKEGRGVNLLLLQTRSRPVCLAPGQPCGRDLSLVWFQSRTYVESVYIYGNVNVRSSLHDCEWYAHMYPCQVCEMFMNMVWNTPLVYYNSKWILNSEIKMFIKNSNVFKRSETKRQFVSENIENSLCTQAILKTDFFSNCPC